MATKKRRERRYVARTIKVPLSVGVSSRLGRERSVLAWRSQPLARATAYEPRRYEALPNARVRSGSVRRTVSANDVLRRWHLATVARAYWRSHGFPKTQAMPPYRTPCSRRAARRGVMFAKRVAGAKWSSGGPRMHGARHTINSSYTCRR